ncbi:hypothetical protein I6N95_06020 [Vagococcus sp. BWB3-3]|uniref:Uncharacterized protein n=1 Tax=Vagococcus allomyrinae TaxID=2794353 RepID=A0A940PBR8_9ENTE|nr:hypothetical protein [Vagococcus allomyrinae]MBP1040551.1 hypothetical protein [Vagococcus allomyrinae]
MERKKYRKLREYKEYKYVGFCLIFTSAFILLQANSIEYFFTNMSYFQRIVLSVFIGTILLQLFKWLKSEMDRNVHIIIFSALLIILFSLNVTALFFINTLSINLFAIIFDLMIVQTFLSIMLEKIEKHWKNYQKETKDKTEVLSTAIAILAAVVSLIALFK